MDASTQIRLETLAWVAATVVFIAVGSTLIAYVARYIAGRAGLSDAEQRKVFWGFFFASPWLIGFVIFVVGPSLASLYYSFTDYKLGNPPEWIGLENYRDLIGSEGASGRRFKEAMYNSMYYAIVGVPLQILAALIMAMLLNVALPGIRMFRLIFYMPVILAGGPAILLAWRYMLSSNGGFINEATRGLADSFFLFDWLYRGFIYVMEGFNGFYAGLTRGDPIGPLKYALPALIGVLAVYLIMRGDWDRGKRTLAQRIAELLAIIVGGILIAGGFTQDPLDVNLTLLFGLIAAGGVALNTAIKQNRTTRLWQYGGLGVLALGAVLTLVHASTAPVEADTSSVNLSMAYLSAILVAALPLIVSFIPGWGRDKQRLLAVCTVLIAAVLLVRIAPGQLDEGRPLVIAQMMTLQSTLQYPDDADYLRKVYPEDTLSSLWIYGAVLAVMVGAWWYNSRNERVHRTFLTGALVVFGLIAVGAIIDGIRYFNAYEEIALATGGRNFHFALFRSSTLVFPDSNRVPLWLSSELWAKPALILITMWSSGQGMLIFLAALKGVPKSLYEAAEVDGANRVQRFFRITLPMISPAMFYNVVIGMIGALQTFEMVYILQNPNNQSSLASAAYYLYQRTFQQLNIGEGAAMSWILAVIIVIMTIIQFRYSDWVHYEA